MCGIAGVYAYGSRAPKVDAEELLRSRDSMLARGPDGAGLWLSNDGQVGLAHRRLSLLDLSERGSQPMASANGRFHITFNGEIYNFQALRLELKSKGLVFHSDTDTEVLLHLYAQRGCEMVHALRGMFAFAIWDDVSQSLFVARDPYGIKPLYFANDGKTFRFASTVGALIAGGGISSESDAAAWAGFYLFGSVPQPLTTLKAVRCLSAGSTMMVTRAGAALAQAYFSIAHSYCAAESRALNPDKRVLQQMAREALVDSVRHHLVADLPVGVFLSGGIDSGALVGLMRDCGQSIHAVTLQFGELQGGSEDEGPGAAVVAHQYGANHTLRRVSNREFEDDLPKIFAAMDQPSIDGVNTWFVSKATHELGLKAALSGVGGDELIGGYSTFQTVPRLVRRLSLLSRLPGLGAMFQRVLRYGNFHGFKLHPKAAGLIQFGGTLAGAYYLQRGLFMPWDLPHLNDAGVGRALTEGDCDPIKIVSTAFDYEPATLFGRMATLESSLYLRNQLLRDADWAGMAHSVEIRTPYVDSVLLTRLAPLMVGGGNFSTKAILANCPSTPLPDIVTTRPRTGFTLPMADWIGASGSSQWARDWAQRVALKYSERPLERPEVAAPFSVVGADETYGLGG